MRAAFYPGSTRIAHGPHYANVRMQVVCGGDFNTPVVNNARLNNGVGIFGAAKEAIGSTSVVARGATATAATNVNAEATYN